MREVALDLNFSLGLASPRSSEWQINALLIFLSSGVPQLNLWPVKVRISSSMRVALDFNFSLSVHAPAFNFLAVHHEDLHNCTSTCF
jgi:hypothetical protein